MSKVLTIVCRLRSLYVFSKYWVSGLDFDDPLAINATLKRLYTSAGVRGSTVTIELTFISCARVFP